MYRSSAKDCQQDLVYNAPAHTYTLVRMPGTPQKIYTTKMSFLVGALLLVNRRTIVQTFFLSSHGTDPIRT